MYWLIGTLFLNVGYKIVLSEDYACMHENTHNNIHIQNKQNKTNQPTNATNILTLGDQVGT